MLVVLFAKTLKIMTGTTVLDVFLWLTLLDPKKLQTTNLHDDDDDDVLLDVLGTLRECYVSSLLGLKTFPPRSARAGVSGKQLVATSDPNATSRFSANARARVGGKVWDQADY